MGEGFGCFGRESTSGRHLFDANDVKPRLTSPSDMFQLGCFGEDAGSLP
jgi:hypothetical protein